MLFSILLWCDLLQRLNQGCFVPTTVIGTFVMQSPFVFVMSFTRELLVQLSPLCVKSQSQACSFCQHVPVCENM